MYEEIENEMYEIMDVCHDYNVSDVDSDEDYDDNDDFPMYLEYDDWKYDHMEIDRDYDY